MKHWKVSYVDGLQGKTHQVVVDAESGPEAVLKASKQYSWQQPSSFSTMEYKHADRPTN